MVPGKSSKNVIKWRWWNFRPEKATLRPFALSKYIRHVVEGKQLGRSSNLETIRGQYATVSAIGWGIDWGNSERNYRVLLDLFRTPKRCESYQLQRFRLSVTGLYTTSILQYFRSAVQWRHIGLMSLIYISDPEVQVRFLMFLRFFNSIILSSDLWIFVS